MTAPASLVPEAPPRLARAVAVIRATFGGDAEAIATFAAALFARGAGEYLEQLGEDQAAAVAAHAFRFVAAGGPMPRVRVFDPSFAVDGWESSGTVLETVMPDRPFIVDTLREYLRSEDIALQVLLHPVVAVDREPAAANEAAGPLRAVYGTQRGATHESIVHAVLEPLPRERLAAIETEVRERLRDVLLVTGDFDAMVARTEAVAEELAQQVATAGGPSRAEVAEAQEFLRWLAHGGWVLLGYCSLTLEAVSTPRLRIDRGSGLGLFRDRPASHDVGSTPLAEVTGELRERSVGGSPVTIARTTAHSPVHRRVRMDYVAVKRLDAGGTVCGEHRFLGLLTSKAFAEEAAEIPILRRRLQEILDAEHVARGSHDHKEIVAIFNSMPKAELFSLPLDALRGDIRMIMAIQQSDDVRVSFRPDALARGVAVMVIMPRDKFSAAIRTRIQDALAARFGGQVIDYHLALGESERARLHFYLAAPRERIQAVRWRDLQHEIAGVTRSWDDRLRERLVGAYGHEQGTALAERYARALPAEYKATAEIAAAVHDVGHLEALRSGAGFRIDIQNPVGARERFTAIKLYARGEQLVLSDVMPVLENLGLRVFAEDPVTIPALDGQPIYLDTFLVQDGTGGRLDVQRDAARLIAALTQVRAGIENDALNRLVLGAGLSWQQVDLLRTYCNYAFQIGVAPSRRAIVDALVRHPDCATLLPRYYDARFAPPDAAAPAGTPDRDAEVAAARQAFLTSLDAVTNIGEDRVLRALFGLIEATVRTNYYAFLAGRRGHVAIKLDASRIDELPRPRPLYEIYVHSPTMEGVHLRAGRIARGGIRFSDRHDDFRAEILGLMKTQTVKNAVIVPVGAKGGFIVKRGTSPDAIIDAYSTLIRGMLDLTDGYRGERTVPPPNVVCYDEPDPYLVVAADKGTATFSDHANAIAAEYGFWLGDAFASGGSHGYDHKKLGITARGAWECVAQHFRTLDGGALDVDHDPITVAGIGDMSGDVFGNAMLLSRTLKLRAAFDHRHIFLDPDPDPARSYGERARLFALPRSSWADYDPRALSRGATVVARGAKVVTLSPELRAVLGVEAPTLDADSLIQTILRMETDLLFNGGIGTYVKARGETNAEVGDSANASVRVNGGELRARVVAEGGNLGFTQHGRIEYALAGGRIDTDAIDNSAGVDMSDHEVNLKIALQPLVESGELSIAQRNRVLADVEDAVTALVLDHNRGQARILTRDRQRSALRLIDFRDLMTELESSGLLDRGLEALPDRESLKARRATVLGLTRPELAVLLAYAKMHCTRVVAASAVADDPYLDRVLFGYFPALLGERFPDAIRRHRLRRELVATTLANRVVDLLGMTFVTRTARETGAEPAAVVRAFVIVDAIVGAVRVARDAAALGAATETGVLDTLLPAVEAATRWLVDGDRAAEPLTSVVSRFTTAFTGVRDALSPARRERRARRAAALAAAAVPAALVERCLDAEALPEILDVIAVATETGAPLAAAAAAYWRLDDLTDFAWLAQALRTVAAESRAERRAVDMLTADLHRLRRALSRRLVAATPDVDTAVAELRERRTLELERLRGLVDELRTAGTTTLAAMMIVVGELRRLEERAWS